MTTEPPAPTSEAASAPPPAPAGIPAQGPAALSRRAAEWLVFVCSGAVLVLEILSLRLVAPYLGLTLETNTAVIGFALAAIATGAWLGGRAADNVPPQRALGPLVLTAGIGVLFVGPVVRWTGESLRGQDVSAVLFMAAAAVFVPAALLSAISPMVVKLQLATLAETGTIVGRLSGIGTFGAIAATFGTGFVLVAAVPTSLILLTLGGLLVLLGLVLIVRMRGLRPAGGRRTLIVPAVAVLGAAAAGLAPQPCDTETAYHCARVSIDPQRPTGRILHLDTLQHSYVDLADPTYLEFSYVRAIAAGADMLRPPGQPVRALHLGGGGLTLPRYLEATRPGSDSLVFEIDKGVVGLDRTRLGARLGDGIAVQVKDARAGLAAQPPDSRELIIGDAFGGLAVPWHLTTREVVADVRRVLVPDGLYAVNMVDYPPLGFVRAEVATLAAVFEHVAVMASPEALAGRAGGNVVAVASDTPLPLEALRERLAGQGRGWQVLAGPDRLREFTGDARVLTDDFAPVDQLLTPFPTA